MTDSALIGLIVTGVMALIGYLLKREVNNLDNKLDHYNSRLDFLEEIHKDHSNQIAVNAERDKADFKLLEASIMRVKAETDKEIRNLNILNDTRFKTLTDTLERILNKLDNYDQYFTKK